MGASSPRVLLIGGILAAAVFARPQVVLLTGLLTVPLSGALPNATSAVIAFVSILVISGVRGVLARQAVKPAIATAALPMMAVWVLMSVSLPTSVVSQTASVSEVMQPIVGTTIALIAALFPIHPSTFARVAIPGAALVSLSAIYGVTGLDGRSRALGLNPDYVAILVVLMIAAVVAGRLSRRLAIVGALVIFPLALVALARTQSRAAFITLAIVIVVFLVGRDRGALFGRNRVTAAAVLAATIVFVLIAFPGTADMLQAQFFSQRTSLDYASSNQERTLALIASVRLMAAHPLLGVGYGNFPTIASGLPGLFDFVNTHNEYTRFGAELGLVGLVLLLVPLVSAIRRTIHARTLNVLAVLLVMSTAMLAGNFLNSVVTAYPFWLALGIGLSMRGGHAATRREADSQAKPFALFSNARRRRTNEHTRSDHKC